ncbi:hypothetical protein [Mycolicibacterium sp. 120270]|uniref:hypothetical protein n=1 Tax=Mycolicibacterium sp. 120270 TaxID=3090600 RepID=UPI00299E9C68|nr:hypothetical protein [Mycolicibacterium sp. 120270]MDX1882774.1 hypothetical protein [Mycolicibacterium sp. 120270]
MDGSPESDLRRDRLIRLAQELAADADKRVPAWVRHGDPESATPVRIAVLAVMAQQIAIPRAYTVVPRWPLLVLEILLLLALLAINPRVMSRRTRFGRYATWALLAAITVDNTASAIVLDIRILTGEVSNDAAVLLGSGAAIFVTNIIVFGIWYWELDRGGPFARHVGERPYPDFLFPQMATPNVAKPDWRPTFVDYLYVSVTNVMAFSPTDTMPLARWAKMLMTLQAMVALSTAALVIARAVNVLG